MKLLIFLLLLTRVATAQTPVDSSNLSALSLKRPVIVRINPPTPKRDSLERVLKNIAFRDSTRISKTGDTLILRAKPVRLQQPDDGFVNKGDEPVAITTRQWRKLNQQLDQLLQAVKQLQVKKP